MIELLDFINNNGILCTCAATILASLIAAIVSLVNSNKKMKQDSINSLKKDIAIKEEELSKLRNELHIAKSKTIAEKSIDKTKGTIYYETLEGGDVRAICGLCWEKEQVKVPIVTDLCDDDGYSRPYYGGYCHSCKTFCKEHSEAIEGSSVEVW